MNKYIKNLLSKIDDDPDVAISEIVIGILVLILMMIVLQW